MQSQWSFLREWTWKESTAPTTWSNALALADAFAKFEAPLRKRLAHALECSDRALSEIDGDPLHEDWWQFRPLRLGREEDWSDWLKWLIENSRSGHLAALLFERGVDRCKVRGVDRELPVGSYRLDLRIRWSNGELTTVEVKVGDQAFKKTEDAAKAHRHLHSGKPCDDWILLPPEDLNSCDFSAVRKIGWKHVTKSLRACLDDKNESCTWRVWGRAFVGCIEQKLLRYPQIGDIDRVLDLRPLLEYLEQKHGDG